MERAFGELEQKFYDSGGVMSQRTATDYQRTPRRPIVERSSPLTISGKFTKTVVLGVPDCVELGGYYAFYVADGPDDLADYVSFELATD